MVLRAAVQNEDLVHATAATASDLQFEVVEYLVVATPALSITTSTPMNFNLTSWFKINYLFTTGMTNRFLSCVVNEENVSTKTDKIAHKIADMIEGTLEQPPGKRHQPPVIHTAKGSGWDIKRILTGMQNTVSAIAQGA